MDKQTLSNYGWIVICILVLSVMIAFATPFGSFIASGVKSTTQGLFDVNQKAFNNVGFGQIADQEFENHYSGNGTGGGIQVSVPGTTFSKYLTSPGCHQYPAQHTNDCYTECEPITLTWDELKLADNGTKYGYKASKITDTSIGNEVFSYCDSLTSIDLPDSLTTIGSSAFQGCDSLTSIDLSGCTSLTSISNNAFSYCNSLTSIDLPDSLTSIGEYAFNNCASLTSIDLPDSITTIGKTAFQRCPLRNIDLPDSLTSIGEYTFNVCTSLTSIDLSGCTSLTSISNNAFSYCNSLTSIDLPDSLTSIGEYAFSYCTALTSINYAGSMEDWGNISLDADWKGDSNIKQIICNDGTITL